MNPEPVAAFMDLVCVGEGEPILPPLLAVMKKGDERGEILRDAAGLPGVYVPSLYEVSYEGAWPVALNTLIVWKPGRFELFDFHVFRITPSTSFSPFPNLLIFRIIPV